MAIGAIVLAGEKNRVETFAICPEHPNIFDSKRFGRVVTIGSGAETVIRQVQELDKYKSGHTTPPDGGKGFPEFSTLSHNLMLLANLYWNEIVIGDNLFESWGGAYDLIYRDAKKTFRYLKEYTIFFRRYDHQQSDQGIQLVNVLKYERGSDISLLSMLHDGQLAFFGARDITDPDDALTIKVGGPDFTMNSKVHISIIQVCKGRVFVPPIIQIDGLGKDDDTRQTVFTMFGEDGRLHVLFNSEHDKWLVQEVKDYYQMASDRIDRTGRFFSSHWG